jgi:hypothetical protein
MRRVTLVVVACAASCVTLLHADSTRAIHESMYARVRPYLPSSRSSMDDADLPSLQRRLTAEVAKLGKSNNEVVLTQARQSLLSMRIGIDLGCGPDQALFVFDYSSGTPRLILEDHPKSSWGESVVLEVAGSVLLTQRFGINCGSSWYSMRYTLYRIGRTARPIHESTHSVWFGFGDNAVKTRLTERELLMEIRDRSIDTGIHNRPHVLRLAIQGDTVTRMDPVATHPRDFVDEWINRPWTEMASRTDSPDRWRQVHEMLHREARFAEFELLQKCSSIASTWQIGLHGHYFLVRDLGEYRYRMVDISTTRQAGCPGQGNAIEIDVPGPK